MKPFKIGDLIYSVDSELSGIVIEINSQNVVFRDSDGFEHIANFDEVILNNALHTDLLGPIVVKDVSEISRHYPSKKNQKTNEMVVDLHAHAILSQTKGLSIHQIVLYQLNEAKKSLERAKKQRISKLVLIHGIGQGVLRKHIEEWLNSVPGIEYFDAELSKFGKGATEVRIYRF